jgi:hypothetical protein
LWRLQRAAIETELFEIQAEVLQERCRNTAYKQSRPTLNIVLFITCRYLHSIPLPHMMPNVSVMTTMLKANSVSSALQQDIAALL